MSLGSMKFWNNNQAEKIKLQWLTNEQDLTIALSKLILNLFYFANTNLALQGDIINFILMCVRFHSDSAVEM